MSNPTNPWTITESDTEIEFIFDDGSGITLSTPRGDTGATVSGFLTDEAILSLGNAIRRNG